MTAKDWAAVAAIAACATVLVYVVLGIFAWIQLRQARQLREDQARPFVIVDFEPGFLVYLTVENIGKTMARDVTIKFDQKLETTLSRPREIDESPIFRSPTPTFPPGKKIRILFDSYAARVDAKLPLTYEVTVKYRGTTGMKPYDETYRLDLGMYLGSEPDKGMSELIGEVAEIRKEIQKARNDPNGFPVHITDVPQRNRQRMRRYRVGMFRQEGARVLARYQWDRLLRQIGVR